MTESRSIIRVFLASPGDLVEERRAAKDAVDEINATIAKPSGYQIDLFGWEDTISATGRPQAIINQELKRCELFVGMIWAKWGTPPDNGGKFTSGFEEEFTLASQQRAKEGFPEMRMYFKTVDEVRRKDPGQELSKVLAFQSKLIEEKNILFEQFSDTSEFARRLRIGLADYVNQKKLSEAEPEQTASATSALAESHAEELETASDGASGSFQAKYLQRFAKKLNGSASDESITPSDIARLRLAGMTHSWVGNDEPELGPHDVNLLYRQKSNYEFDDAEIRRLTQFGLGAQVAQNKPLWSWLSAVISVDEDWLTFATLSTTKSWRKGAFEAARLGGFHILNAIALNRKKIVELWLNGEDDEAHKVALEYLRFEGTEPDLEIILPRLSDAGSGVFRNYLEAVVAIQLRYNPCKAAETLIQSQFDQFELDILNPALQAFQLLSAADLENGLEHRNSSVRHAALSELHKRKLADKDVGRRFADDGNLQVRKIALAIIEANEGELPLSEVDKILDKSKLGVGGVYFGGGSKFDAAGYRALQLEKAERIGRRPLPVLNSMIKNGENDNAIAYFALVRRDWAANVDKLRQNFDDRFMHFFEESLRSTENRLGSSQNVKDLIERMRAGSDYTRKKHMRAAMDLLTLHPVAQDLNRIRSAIDDGSVEIGRSTFIYFSKLGDWSDIDRLAKMGAQREEDDNTILGISRNFTAEAAQAIYKIGKGRFTELISIDLPPELKTHLLKMATQAEIRALVDSTIDQFLLNQSASLRKAMALKAVVSVGPKRAKKILQRHLDSPSWFYNVVHWLDLVIAFPYDRAKEIARRALAE